jgi:hypothetical protein
VSDETLRRLATLRAREPERIAAAAAVRRRPETSFGDGPTLIVAADHSARGMVGAGRHPGAMADRGDLLERLCLALSRPGVTGVLGTPDILEDLLLLGVLEGKAVFGSMNRGGLKGARWEIDDRFTAYDAATLEAMGFEGGKMLVRFDLDDPATAATSEACARAVGALAQRRLIAMVEPFMARTVDGRVTHELTTEAAVKASMIAAGLGPTSAYTWLKIPVVDDMERVAAPTAQPTLLLGGEVADDQDATFERWRAALALPNVFGLVVGRSLLYPPAGDVAAAVDAAAGLFPERAAAS